jgi:hypothetical protein
MAIATVHVSADLELTGSYALHHCLVPVRKSLRVAVPLRNRSDSELSAMKALPAQCDRSGVTREPSGGTVDS